MEKFIFYGDGSRGQETHQSLINSTIIAKSDAELENLLTNQSLHIRCTIVNLPIISLELVATIKKIRFNRPLVPITAFKDPEKDYTSEIQRTLFDLSIDFLIGTDTDLDEMNELISGNNKSTLHAIPEHEDHYPDVEKESLLLNNNFFSIHIKDILPGSISHFDIYIKLRSDKYVKIFKKKDSLPPERLKNYVEKGVRDFFLLKSEHEGFLKFCDDLTDSLLVQQGQMNSWMSPILLLGDQILTSFELNGVNPENILYAKKFLEKSLKLTKNILGQNNKVQQLILNSLKDYQHTTTVVILGGMLSRTLGFTSRERIDSIALSLMLHDLGLNYIDPKFKNMHSTKTLSSSELEEYKTHSFKAYDLLKEIPEIPQVTLQAILQHHERRDHSGYPDQLSGAGINFIAEIIGLCDEYVCYLEDNNFDHQGFLNIIDTDLKMKFSISLITSFKAIFGR